MKIRFLGAVGAVTGSCSLLEHPRTQTRFLVDCGMTQGEIDAGVLNAAPWPFAAFRVSFVLLTHAHIDHCGLLPRLVREGFQGPVYCTRFTAELSRINLQSAARLPGATFTSGDVNRINFVPVDASATFEFGRFFSIGQDLEAAFSPSAHIGGACSICVRWQTADNKWREMAFSSDLGPNVAASAPQPLLAGRLPLRSNPDYLLVESTYGSRQRPPVYASSSARLDELQRLLGESIDRLGAAGEGARSTVVIPCFSIHRCQELLADLHTVLDVGMRDRLVQTRPAHQQPEHLDSSLLHGLRANRIQSRYRGILPSLSTSAQARFHELFRLTTVTDGKGKPADVFLPVDSSTETLEEARLLLSPALYCSPRFPIQVLVDSPLSHRVTRVYRRELRRRTPGDPSRLLYRNEALKTQFRAETEDDVDRILDGLFLDKEGHEMVQQEFEAYTLTFCHPEESETRLLPQGLNIVLSGSGMGDHGPIVSHLERHLRDPHATILLTGYAAAGTVAGQLKTLAVNGAASADALLMLGNTKIPHSQVRARIEDLGPYYSGHADQAGLLDFIFSTPARGGETAPPATVFLNHGSDDVRVALRAAILQRQAASRPDDRLLHAVEVPSRDHGWFDLDGGMWLPRDPLAPENRIEEMLMRLLVEQRRTNDLLLELVQHQRQRAFDRPS